MLISMSGIDSAGKTTQVDLLCDYCKSRGISVKRVWSKARGTPGVLFLKELFRRDKHMNSEDKAEYRQNVYGNIHKKRLLYVASMLDLCWYWGVYSRLLKLRYRVVVCDRYLWDTFVELNHDFQGINISKSILWRLVKAIAPKPCHSFLFVIPAELSIARDRQKHAAGIEPVEVKKEKIDRYLALAGQGKWTDVIEGTRPAEDIHLQIRNTLNL